MYCQFFLYLSKIQASHKSFEKLKLDLVFLLVLTKSPMATVPIIHHIFTYPVQLTS